MTPSFKVPATGTNAALSQRTQSRRAASALSPTGAARSCGVVGGGRGGGGGL